MDRRAPESADAAGASALSLKVIVLPSPGDTMAYGRGNAAPPSAENKSAPPALVPARTVSVALLSSADAARIKTGRELEGEVTVREQLPGLIYTGPAFVVAAPRG